jgi:hypothetical protein
MSFGEDGSLTAIANLLRNVREKFGLDVNGKDDVGGLVADIPKLIEKMPAKDFYQWFCQIWQDYEYNMISLTDEEEVARSVARLARPLTEGGVSNPPLRAMCMSFMMNSLPGHVIAQSYCLRMLLLFAMQTTLCQERRFLRWILRFMEKRIDSMINIEKSRGLFVSVCVDFFHAIPKYDHLCVVSVLKFFGAQKFSKSLTRNGETEKKLRRIATETLNAALTEPGQFFVFEVIRDTQLVLNNLTDEQKEVLNVFVEGSFDDFEKLIATGKNKYVTEAGLDQEMLRFKMRVLIFVSICWEKTTVSFDEIERACQLNDLALKQLVVRINATDAARVRINSVGRVFEVEYCQPRQFKDEEWEKMGGHLEGLIASLSDTRNALAGGV